MVFACIIHIVRILHAEHRDLCGCSVCCMLKAVRCGFYIRDTKIFAFCKRMRPKRTKIWWGTDVENFALESVYTASRTWVGYEQRFLFQIYSLTCCSTCRAVTYRDTAVQVSGNGRNTG